MLRALENYPFWIALYLNGSLAANSFLLNYQLSGTNSVKQPTFLTNCDKNNIIILNCYLRGLLKICRNKIMM